MSWGGEADGGQRRALELACEMGVSMHTPHAWKAKYGGLGVNEAR